ncbi:unnamed protein product [Paramecium octaurelia]|uniref:Uncharacterized protein n=1 Tax=Paramecium octaurelia TaxID=43137 RepID=A0A8S1UA43_PAROT|nr:unnamed protein product [Paramecium octaurelia]
MRFGRVGAISAITRVKRSESYLAGKSDDIELTEKQLNHAEKIMRSISKDQKSLVLYRVPVFIWGIGILIIMLSLYLLYNLIWGLEGKVFKQGTTWWQYFVSFIIMGIGISFLIATKREKLIFNKEKDEIILCYRNICCQKKVMEQKISHLSNMRMVKRGMDSIQNSTLHYKIVLSFNDGQYFEILEGKSEYKIKGQFVQIAKYINYAYQDLQIVDETFQVR